MGNKHSDLDDGAPVDFGRRLADSEAFWTVFREGMALVEETANYLEGTGKAESRQLSRAASVAFGTESMRLTTRLMQLASWLLLQRAINDGSVAEDRAESEREKVRIGALVTVTEGPDWDALPANIQNLIRRSLALQDRVLAFDRQLREPVSPVAVDNPVAQAIGRISAAFGASR